MRRRLRSCAEYGRRKFMACLQSSLCDLGRKIARTMFVSIERM
jgi:hypothetical protein